MKTFLFILVFSVCTFTMGGDYWWPKWMPLELGGAALLAYSVRSRFGWIAGLTFLWPLIWAMLIFGDQTVAVGIDGSKVLAVENVMLKATVALVFSVMIPTLLKQCHYEQIEELFGFICLIDSVTVLVQHFAGWEVHGLLGNPSMNGCLIAMTLPYLSFKHFFVAGKGELSQKTFNAIGLLLVCTAVFLSQASVPVGVLGVVVASYMVCAWDDKVKGMSTKIVIAFFLLAALFICGLQLIPNFLADSGRFSIWRASLDWWWQNGSHLIGTGNGTYFLIGPVVQEHYNIGVDLKAGTGNYFVWVHNDWIQTLIEQGVFGLVLTALLFFTAARRAWKNSWAYEFAALMGFGATACFNFPVHQAPVVLFALIMVAKILDLKRPDWMEYKPTFNSFGKPVKIRLPKGMKVNGELL